LSKPPDEARKTAERPEAPLPGRLDALIVEPEGRIQRGRDAHVSNVAVRFHDHGQEERAFDVGNVTPSSFGSQATVWPSH
jgi:hypothetical protein